MSVSLVPRLAFFLITILGGQALTQSFTQAALPNSSTETSIIPVDSPAFVFSPGNWTGDQGREGHLYRQSWNPYAYCRITWESSSSAPKASILLDTSTYPSNCPSPNLAYCIDGIWKAPVPCSDEITIPEISGSGRHELGVYLVNSKQVQRWGGEATNGQNVLRVTGLKVDSASKPLPNAEQGKWALIIGDSITEGIGTGPLSAYSFLLGEALRTQGYEYGVSACGFSGWLTKGDSQGDVPAYYVVTGSSNGTGGRYDDAASRWNKIDGNRHSLLDRAGHLSAHGKPGQEPSLILINYGTNDFLRKSNSSDATSSITQCLSALRHGAPEAQIILMVPFGQYFSKEIHEALANYKKENPSDQKISLFDLGSGLARNLEQQNGLLGGLHPNDRGDAIIASQIIPQVMTVIHSGSRQ